MVMCVRNVDLWDLVFNLVCEFGFQFSLYCKLVSKLSMEYVVRIRYGKWGLQRILGVVNLTILIIKTWITVFFLSFKSVDDYFCVTSNSSVFF